MFMLLCRIFSIVALVAAIIGVLLIMFSIAIVIDVITKGRK